MPQYKKPMSNEEFNLNFAQIKPLMSDTEAYYESSRCLYCYDAPCITACPTGIDIPLFIRQINSKNEQGAAKTIYDSNIFGYACGKVCPTEVLCEGACVYNHSDVKPIEIGRLQSYATKKSIDSGKKHFNFKAPIGKKVAIIGAGPAGISCGAELSLHGVSVDIFEAREKPSGLTVYGVAPYKITNEEVLSEMEYLEAQYGFKIHYNKFINTRSEIEELQNAYDAIFLGIGLWRSSELGIPGEELDQVTGAVEFIEDLRMQKHQTQIGGKVIVLGGGNTAMDAASESCRMGAADVVIAYRRSHEEMGAYAFEYELAKAAGIRSLFNVMPVEIIGSTSVSAVRFVRTKVEDGKVTVIDGTEFTEPCDWVIKATGQSRQEDLLDMIGIGRSKSGNILVDGEYRTSHHKYFAAGDAVSGGQEVVNAVAEGKKAAKGILKNI